MDRRRLIRLVLVPITVGLVVTLIVRQVTNTATPASTAKVETSPAVVVAGKDPIKLRTRITEAQLAVKQVPKALLTGNEFPDVKSLVGMISMVQLDVGEIVLKSRVVADGTGSLPYRVPAGTRAFSLRVDEFSGVANYPDPGDLVDLIFVLPAKLPERPIATSRLLYESVPVVAKGPNAAVVAPGAKNPLDPTKITSLTVALSPEAATEVALAEELGHIKVMLRPALKEPDAGKILIIDSKYLPPGTPAPAPAPSR